MKHPSIETLARLYSGGLTTPQIASKTGVPATTVFYRLKRAGFALRKRGEKFIDPQELASVYGGGGSLVSCAAHFRVSIPTIRRHLVTHGIPIRRRWQSGLLATDDQIVTEYVAGTTMTNLAVRFKTDRGTIRKLLRGRGIDVRNVRHYIQLPLNHDALDTLTPEAEYWIGFLMADGYVRRWHRYATVKLKLAARDADHLCKFRQFLSAEVAITVGADKNGHRYVEFGVRSIKLADRLAHFGVVPRKSLVEQAAGGVERSRHFWRGVLDGDGCLRWHRNNRDTRVPMLTLTCGEPLVRQFAEFIKSEHGFRPRVFHHNHWRLDIYCQKAKAVAATLYRDCTVALDRKLLVAESFVGY